MKKSITFLIAISAFTIVHAQDSSKTNALGFGLQYVQIKEGANYGLVHQGANISIDYRYNKTTGTRSFGYTPSIAFGANYRNGIGLNWNFRLVDLSYTFRICDKETRNLNLGPYFSSNHLYQLYPELQSGHIFWFTSFEIGPRLVWNLYPGKRHIEIEGAFNLLSLNSRSEQTREEYFYSLNFWDVLSDSHSNMSINSLNNYLHILLSARTRVKKDGKMKIGYAFEYLSFSSTPPFNYLTHSINLSWKLGK